MLSMGLWELVLCAVPVAFVAGIVGLILFFSSRKKKS